MALSEQGEEILRVHGRRRRAIPDWIEAGHDRGADWAEAVRALGAKPLQVVEQPFAVDEVVADRDRVDITSNRGVEPDTGTRPESDLSDYLC